MAADTGGRVADEANRAVRDLDLLDRVRTYKKLMFRRDWEKLDEAK